MEKNAADFQSWVDRLVHACLPLELQKKLLTLQPLTKEEALKYVQVVQLVTQAKSLKKQDDLSEKLDRNTQRILKAIRSEGTKPFDRRSPQERRLIDRAVELYVYRHDVQGLDVPESTCYRTIWHKFNGDKIFRDFRQFENVAHYDLEHFYDVSLLLFKTKEHPPAP